MSTILLSPEVEQAAQQEAERLGLTLSDLVAQVLRTKLLPQKTSHPAVSAQTVEWDRWLLALGKDCGVSLSDESLSSEGLYE